MRPKGFEPPAPGVGGQCSIQLSYGRRFMELLPNRAKAPNAFIVYQIREQNANVFLKNLVSHSNLWIYNNNVTTDTPVLHV